MNLLPRFLRYRDAPGYLGMDRSRFDTDVRPSLVEIPIGRRGIAFDRHDLDAWADEHKRIHGRQKRDLAMTPADAEPANAVDAHQLGASPQSKPRKRCIKTLTYPSNTAGCEPGRESNVERAIRLIDEINSNPGK